MRQLDEAQIRYAFLKGVATGLLVAYISFLVVL